MKDQETYESLFFEDLSIGMRATFEKTFSRETVHLFAELTGDFNPVHVDEAFASTSVFKECVVHGAATTSLFSTIAGTLLPGPGCAYVSQNTKFLSPVKINETVWACLELTKLEEKKRLATFSCLAKVGEREVASGEATLWVPSRPSGEETI